MPGRVPSVADKPAPAGMSDHNIPTKEQGTVDIERVVQQLLDRQQIEDTLYRYASTIDNKDYPRLRSLLVDDAVGKYGDADPIRGADEIVRWIDEATQDRSWQHHKLTVYHV